MLLAEKELPEKVAGDFEFITSVAPGYDPRIIATAIYICHHAAFDGPGLEWVPCSKEYRA